MEKCWGGVCFLGVSYAFKWFLHKNFFWTNGPMQDGYATIKNSTLLFLI